MTVRATWTIAIDLNNDGDFADANEDITSYVMDATWTLGFSAAYETMARSATLNLTLDNSDKRFSPENTSSPLYPNLTRGRTIRVQSTFSATTRTHFIGRLDSIQPVPNTVGPRTAAIFSIGFFQEAQDAEIFIPAQEDKRADQVIETILTNTNIVPAGVLDRWLLGLTNNSELNVNTTLGGTSDFLSAETGLSTFSIIGDQWGENTSMYGALRDVVNREFGRLFVSRSGIVTFWNRQHFLTDVTSDLTLSESNISDMNYTFGDDIKNDVTVRARTRLIGSTNETLGQLDKAVKIKPGKTKTINIRFADQDSGTRIAGKSVVTPIATTDYTANTAEDGTGIDITDSITIVLVDATATRAKVEYTNGGPVDAWLQAGTRIRGLKITDFGEVDVQKTDETSIQTNRRQKFTYPGVMDDVDLAEGMADFILETRKDARGIIRSIAIPAYKDSTILTNVLANSIGTQITLSETQTGISSADYFVIGETFQLAQSNLLVTWILEPATTTTYWILDTVNFSELNTNTTLGPF